jgi:copper oxidase (laccase) domain-containing protein
MMFDLPAYVRSKLYMLGIDKILHINEDTYSNPDKYPSYRRSCNNGETYKENILSTIMIRK